MVRAVHNGRAKSAVHFCCSGDVPAVFQRPLEYRRNVAGTNYLNLAGTRILGLPDTTLLHLFTGGDIEWDALRQALAAPPPDLNPATKPSRPPTSSVPASIVPPRTPKSTPQSTCSACLGRPSSTGTGGRPNTAPARQPQPQHQHQQQQQQRQQEQSEGGLPLVARALAWDDGE